jgi:uncharacterized protein (TIGR02466 family)
MEKISEQLGSGASIMGIFPEPIYQKNISRQFFDNEMKFITSEKLLLTHGSGNTRSHDDQILDHPIFFNIKNFINSCLVDYVQSILSPPTDMKLAITQSWLNFNGPGQEHNMHYHSNSIVSGVIYFSTADSDKICFYKSNKPQIHIQYTPNVWNARKQCIPVQTGDLLLFNSMLEHGVDQIIDENRVRISLAFNTWFVGEIGSREALTRLSNPL